MAFRFLTLFFLSFSFICFPLKGNTQSKTEAAFFNLECLSCDANEDLQFFLDRQECFKNISSKECDSISREEKKTCTEKDEEYPDTVSFLWKCAKDAVLTYKHIFDLLWYSIISASSWLLGSDQDTESSSSKSYIFIEFYKAYVAAKGTQIEKAITAASIVGGQTFNSLWSIVKNFIYKEIKTLKCYKPHIQTSLACSFFVSLFLPGTSFLAYAKIGAKSIKRPVLSASTLAVSTTKKIQLNSVTRNIRTHFDSFKKHILRKSRILSRRQKREIQRFFQNIDANSFVSNVQSTLVKKFNTGTGFTREQIKEAILLSLTVGTVGNVAKLSYKSAVFVSEGLTNTLLLEYANDIKREKLAHDN